MWLTVINEIFEVLPQLDPFYQINHLSEFQLLNSKMIHLDEKSDLSTKIW